MNFANNVHEKNCNGVSSEVCLEHAQVDPFWKAVNHYQDRHVSVERWDSQWSQVRGPPIDEKGLVGGKVNHPIFDWHIWCTNYQHKQLQID